ncbi:MAG: BON domain-containing protein [Anaerolinea sp.]|nr:BON domain-containing protein [Anaerolinea sp.]
MTDHSAPAARIDSDIVEDIHTIIVKYPPTNNDRHHIHVRVEDGVAYLSGHVQTPIHRRYLQEKVALVNGVREVNVTELHDDETIRLEVGAVVPEGTQVNVRYGVVLLSGAPIDEAVAERVASMPGVVRVVTAG